MTDHALPRHEIGANNPPPEDLAEVLAEQHAKFLERQADHELAASALPKEVKSDEDVAKITAWVVEARKIAKEAETEHGEAKRPVLDRGRAIDKFFFTIRDTMKARAGSIEQRNAPYLAAKAAAERAAREAAEAATRRAAQEAQERADREAAERAAKQREADEALARAAAETDEARRAEAQEEARRAGVEAQLAAEAAEQAVQDQAAATKLADRQAKGAASHTLGRTAGEAGSVNTKEEPRYRIRDTAALIRSLGPLGPYLTDNDVQDAIKRAMKATPQPDLPGVEWFTETVAKTTARRGA